MNPSIAIKNAGFPPLETANGIPSTDVQMEETASDVSSSAQITIEICVPANRTRPALSEEASNSVAKELRDALQPHLDGAGALTNSSKIPRFLAAVHKLKDPTLKLQSLAALEAVKDTKVLTDLTKSKIPDLFRVWLTTAIKENGKQQNEVIASILRILLALPMTLDVLRASSLGKFVNRLKKHEETDINALASTLYEQWTVLLSTADPNAAPAVVQEKQPPPPAIQQQKRSTAGNVATPSPAAAARKAVDLDIFDMFGPSTTGGDAAQKGQKRQKLELPKIPKRPLAAKSSESSSVASSATGSSDDLTGATVFSANVAPVDTNDLLTTRKTKKKSVRWAPDSLLCQVKLFHSEETGGKHPHRYKSAKEMDRNEAGTVIQMLRNEMIPTIDWRPLIALRYPQSVELPVVESKEAAIQTERERSILAAIYVDLSSIPPSPKEPKSEDSGPTISDYEVPKIQLEMVLAHEEGQQQQQLLATGSAPYYPPQQRTDHQMQYSYYPKPSMYADMPANGMYNMAPSGVYAPVMHPIPQQPHQLLSMIPGHQVPPGAAYYGQYAQYQQQQQQQPHHHHHPATMAFTIQQQQQQQASPYQPQPQVKQPLVKSVMPPCKFGKKCKRRGKCKFLHEDD